MAFSLGDIIVTIKANTDSLKQGLKEIEKFTDKTSSGVQGLNSFASGVENFAKKAAVGLGIASAAATAFGVVSVKAFSESEDVMTQTQAVLKSTGEVAGVTSKQVQDLAKSLQSTTKFSDETVQSGENLLLTFTSISKDIFPQATKTMLDMSQALGQDVKSSAIQLGKALQDPILGVTALRRVGVNFSQDQQDVIANLVETGQKAKAQALILKELQTEFGGSAEAAGTTFSGKLAILKNKFNDLQETIGLTIVRSISPFADKLVNFVNSDKFVEWSDRAGAALTNGIGAAMKFLVDVVLPKLVFMFKVVMATGKALSDFYDHNRTLVKLLAETLGSLTTGLYLVAKGIQVAEAAAKSFDKFMKFMTETNPWLLLIAAIIAATILIIANWDTLKKWFDGFWGFIKRIFSDGVNFIKDHWQILLDILLGPLGYVIGQIITHWDTIKSAAVTAFDAIKNVFMYFWNFAVFVWQTVKAVAVWAWQGIYNEAIKPVIDAITAIVGALYNFMVGVWQGIWSVIGPIFGAIGNAAQSAWNFVVSVWQGAYGWFANIAGSISGAFQKAADTIGGFFSGIWGSVKNTFKAGANWVIDQLNHLINAYNKTLGKIPNTPKIANLDRFAKGTENFAGGGAIVGEQGPELGLFPRGTKIVPANLTRNLVDNLMSVGDMLTSLLRGGANNLVAAGPGVAAQPARIERNTNFYGPINIGSEQDADYLLKQIDRNAKLEEIGGTA